MSNINLALGETPRNNSRTAKSGLLISAIVLILLICLYGALLFINKKVSAQISSVQNQYKTEYGKLLAGDGNNIIDFENRSKVAQELISQDKPVSILFSQIESSLLPAVYLTSYKYNKKEGIIALNCVGDNFNTVAKQILSFKENGYFSQVIPGQSQIDVKTNQLNFSINLKIK
ncbi:MAG TPA: hypothetical protein ENL05_01005 [Candidatus Moranbacteria bacterium]|nr:hypothetical protein [Candidatus Moranbacteria bacterium]